MGITEQEVVLRRQVAKAAHKTIKTATNTAPTVLAEGKRQSDNTIYDESDSNASHTKAKRLRTELPQLDCSFVLPVVCPHDSLASSSPYTLSPLSPLTPTTSFPSSPVTAKQEFLDGVLGVQCSGAAPTVIWKTNPSIETVLPYISASISDPARNLLDKVFICHLHSC